MHQTTIRFGSDLWEALAVSAFAEGVSVAQYVRESAVERLARTGLPELGEPVAATDRRRDARAPRRAARTLAGTSPVAEADLRRGLLPEGGGDDDAGRGVPVRLGGGAGRAELLHRGVAGRRTAARHTESSVAVWAQSRLARARARELRAASRALVAARRGGQAGAGVPEGEAGAPEHGAAGASRTAS